MLSAPLSDVRFGDSIQNSTCREDYSAVNAPNTEKLSLQLSKPTGMLPLNPPDPLSWLSALIYHKLSTGRNAAPVLVAKHQLEFIAQRTR